MKKEVKKFETKEIKKSKYMNDDVSKIISFIIVLVIVGLFIGTLFFINGKYVTKDEFQDNKTTESVTIDQKLVTLDGIFKVSKNEYYVLAYSLKNTKVGSTLTSLKNSYSGDIYVANLDETVNKGHYDTTKEEKVNVKDVKELNLTKPTLIKIKDKKIVSYTTDIDEMINLLSKKA